jgi:hypothetical protein
MHCSVGLRVFSRDLNPDEITAILNVPPTRSWKIGDMVSSSSEDSKACSGMWLLEPEIAESEEINSHFSALLRHISGFSENLTRIRSEGQWVDIYCNLAGPNPIAMVLLPATLEHLAKLSLEIDFTIDCCG